MVDLQAMQFCQSEVFDRNVQHDIRAALLCTGLHTQPELMEEDWHQVLGHLHIKLHHVSSMLDSIPHGGQCVFLDGAAAEKIK